MGRPTQGSHDEILDPYDIASLQHNSYHVVTVALVSLAHAGAIDCGERRVEALLPSINTTVAELQAFRERRPALPGGEVAVRAMARDILVRDPVERAVYEVIARTPVTAGNLQAIRNKATPVVEMIVQERLERRRLIPIQAARAARRRLGLAVVSAVVMATALLAVTGGVSRGNWYGLMVVPVLAILVGAPATVLAHMTLRGWLRLQAVRWRHPRPTGISKARAPLGRLSEGRFVLAVHGDMFFWRYDPALALALGLSHRADIPSS